MRKLLWGMSLTVLTLVGISVVLLCTNIYTFNRLTDEAPIAKLRFTQLAPQKYAVELRSGDFCHPQTFVLYGDEWRIDARFLKWKPLANLAGLDAMYRLERLTGRYQTVSDENTNKHQAWRIGKQPKFDLVPYVAHDGKYWSPVDTFFGSSVYEAVDPALEYTVYRSQSGLLVRRQSAAPAHYEEGALVIHIEKGCPQGNSD